MVEISRCEIEKYDEFLWRILFFEKASCRSFPPVKNFSKYSCQESEGFFILQVSGKLIFTKREIFFFKIYNGDRAYFFHLGQQDAETHSLQKFYILEISFLKYNCISRGKNKILELWSRLNEIYIKLKLIEI